jgi:hypothetical protein
MTSVSETADGDRMIEYCEQERFSDTEMVEHRMIAVLLVVDCDWLRRLILSVNNCGVGLVFWMLSSPVTEAVDGITMIEDCEWERVSHTELFLH